LDFGSDNDTPESPHPDDIGATTSEHSAAAAEPHDATQTISRNTPGAQEITDAKLEATAETQVEAMHGDAVALLSDTDVPGSPDQNYMVEPASPASVHQTKGKSKIQEETVAFDDDVEITDSDLDDMIVEEDGQLALGQSDKSDSVADSNDGNLLGQMHPGATLETGGGQQLGSIVVATRRDPSSGLHLPVRQALPTPSIRTTFEEGTMSGSQARPSQVPPRPPRSWRIPHDRTHLLLGMNRIHTDYILSNEFIDDINWMLNSMFNWSGNRAASIMKSFRDDMYNEDRRVTFLSRKTPGLSLSWHVRIENPNRWTQNTSCVTAQERLQQRIEEGEDGYGDYIPTCPGGCGPQCRPLVRTKEQNEQALARGREVRRQEKERKELAAARERNRELAKTMPPPPLPMWVTDRTDQSPPPPPTPKPLSEEDIAKLVAAPLFPPRSLRPQHAELKLNLDQWKRLELAEMESPGLMSGRARDVPSSRYTAATTTPSTPSARKTCIKDTDVAKRRASSYDPTLRFRRGSDSPPGTAARPASQPLLEKKTSDNVEQYRKQLSEIISRSSPESSPEASSKRPSSQVANKRPEKPDQRMEL
jgi:hypothetical protein